MTKAELIELMQHLPDSAPVFIVPVPDEIKANLMMDDLPGTGYEAKFYEQLVLTTDSGTPLPGLYLSLYPNVR